MSNKQIGRRKFIQYSVAGIALAASARAKAEEEQAIAQGDENLFRKESKEVDVLVVGGGTAGVVAALQSARAGAKTILVENESMLGGTMTVGGVAFPGVFHAWGQLIGISFLGNPPKIDLKTHLTRGERSSSPPLGQYSGQQGHARWPRWACGGKDDKSSPFITRSAQSGYAAKSGSFA